MKELDIVKRLGLFNEFKIREIIEIYENEASPPIRNKKLKEYYEELIWDDYIKRKKDLECLERCFNVQSDRIGVLSDKIDKLKTQAICLFILIPLLFVILMIIL